MSTPPDLVDVTFGLAVRPLVKLRTTPRGLRTRRIRRHYDFTAAANNNSADSTSKTGKSGRNT